MIEQNSHLGPSSQFGDVKSRKAAIIALAGRCAAREKQSHDFDVSLAGSLVKCRAAELTARIDVRTAIEQGPNLYERSSRRGDIQRMLPKAAGGVGALQWDPGERRELLVGVAA